MTQSSSLVHIVKYSVHAQGKNIQYIYIYTILVLGNYLIVVSSCLSSLDH